MRYGLLLTSQHKCHDPRVFKNIFDCGFHTDVHAEQDLMRQGHQNFGLDLPVCSWNLEPGSKTFDRGC